MKNPLSRLCDEWYNMVAEREIVSSAEKYAIVPEDPVPWILDVRRELLEKSRADGSPLTAAEIDMILRRKHPTLYAAAVRALVAEAKARQEIGKMTP